MEQLVYYTNPQQDVFTQTARASDSSTADMSFSNFSVKKEAVEHPSHYNQGKIECMDVVRDQNLNFNLGNVIKYIFRSKHKGKEIEDLEKACFYLKYEIDYLKKKEKE